LKLLERLSVEFGPHHLNWVLEWPLDFLERTLGELERIKAESRYLELEETAYVNGLELGRTPHGEIPAAAPFWTTADAYFKRLEHYRIKAGGLSDPQADFDREMDAEFEGFAGLGG